MESFRALLKGWLGKFLLIVFVVLFALAGMDSVILNRGLDQQTQIAKVNGEEVSKAQFDQVLNQEKTRLQEAGVDESQINQQVLEKTILEQLVSQSLLLQQAKKLRLELNNDQIDGVIRQLPFLRDEKTNQFSQSLLDQFISQQGLNLEQLRSMISKENSWNYLAGIILKTSIVTPADQDRLKKLQTEKRTVHWTVVDLPDTFVTPQFSAEQIDQYYQKHIKRYVSPESFDASYVILNTNDLNVPVNLTEADIAKQYQTYLKNEATLEVSHILVTTNEKRNDLAAKKRADDIYKQLESGANFANLAKKYSDYKVSAEKGGRLDAFKRGTHDTDFEKAALSLKAGQYSKPVKTVDGYQILFMHKPIPTLASVRGKMTDLARVSKSANLKTDLVNQSNDLADKNASIEDIAKLLASQVHKVSKQSRDNLADALKQPAVRAQIAAQIESGKPNQTSLAVELDSQHYLWFQLDDYKPLQQLNLAQSKQLVVNDLTKEAELTAKLNDADRIAASLQRDPATASTFDVRFASSTVTRNSRLPAKLTNRIFSLQRPKPKKWSAGRTVVNGDVFVVAVSDVVYDQSSLTDAYLDQLNRYSEVRATQELNDYMHYLKSVSKVKSALAETED